MPNRVAFWCLVPCLAASLSWAASVERARELHLSGDLDAASAELHELLAGDGDPSRRAPALALLGQVEIDRRNWRAALDAWGELTDRHALSEHAAAISPAIRPLQALVECQCEAPAVTAQAAAPAPPGDLPAAREAAPAAAPPPVTAEPATPVTPATGLLLLGGWGVEYEAAIEVTEALAGFLEAEGVAVRAATTEIPAIHGEDAVLAFLLDEARQTNAEGVLFLTSRFDFREYLQVRRYDAGGRELWSDRITGGTALKERRDRGKPNWNLVERLEKKLTKRLGTPDLPTE